MRRSKASTNALSKSEKESYLEWNPKMARGGEHFESAVAKNTKDKMAQIFFSTSPDMHFHKGCKAKGQAGHFEKKLDPILSDLCQLWPIQSIKVWQVF